MNNIWKRSIISLTVFMAFGVMLPAVLPADTAAAKLSIDDEFKRARDLAFSGQRTDSRELLSELLTRKPYYHDIRVFMARVYAWDKEYSKARELVAFVRKNDEDNREALTLSYDIELWSKNYGSALGIADYYLDRYPNDADFLYRKAKVLSAMDRKAEAKEYCSQAIKIDPDNKEARELWNSLNRKELLNEITITYRNDGFNRTFDDWHMMSYQYSRKTGYGSVLLRVNNAERFNRNGFQYEIDMYPKILENAYLYLNAGYSQDSIFPKNRYGAEIFFSLPRSFEFSAGFRNLRFTSSKVIIYTGSLGKYWGNYWGSFRYYYTPKNIGNSKSWNLSIRRYWDDGESYLELFGGRGQSPDQDNSTFEIYSLNSKKYGVALQKELNRYWTFKARWRREDEEVSATTARRQETWSVGLARRF